MGELYYVENKRIEQIQLWADKLLRPGIREWLFDDRAGFVEVFTLLMQPNTAIYVLTENFKEIGIIYITDLFPYRDGILNAVIFEPEDRYKGKFLEITEKVRKDLMELWKITSIETWIREDNTPAIKLVEKLGFQWVGIRRAKKVMGGKTRNLIVFDKIISEE